MRPEEEGACAEAAERSPAGRWVEPRQTLAVQGALPRYEAGLRAGPRPSGSTAVPTGCLEGAAAGGKKPGEGSKRRGKLGLCGAGIVRGGGGSLRANGAGREGQGLRVPAPQRGRDGAHGV